MLLPRQARSQSDSLLAHWFFFCQSRRSFALFFLSRIAALNNCCTFDGPRKGCLVAGNVVKRPMVLRVPRQSRSKLRDVHLHVLPVMGISIQVVHVDHVRDSSAACLDLSRLLGIGELVSDRFVDGSHVPIGVVVVKSLFVEGLVVEGHVVPLVVVNDHPLSVPGMSSLDFSEWLEFPISCVVEIVGRTSHSEVPVVSEWLVN